MRLSPLSTTHARAQSECSVTDRNRTAEETGNIYISSEKQMNGEVEGGGRNGC